MSRRHGQKMGCFEFVVVVIALFVAVQFAVLGLRVLQELVILAGTLLKWLAIGVAGAVGIAAVAAAFAGLGYGLKQMATGFFRWASQPSPRPQQAETPSWVADAPVQARQQASYYKQARTWRDGIARIVRELRTRKWLEKDDARRYRESADAGMQRVRSMERDLKTLRSLPAAEEWAEKVDAAARNLVSRLERTHRALARLLAESALQTAPVVDMNIRDAAEELESLVCALDDVNGSDPVAQAVASVEAADAQSRAAERRTEELVQ